jgi:hypothetical protein
MTINRGSISKQLIPGLNKVFGGSYGKIDNEHLVLFDKEKSNRSFEEEVMFTGLGTAPEKFEGQSIFYDDMRETYTANYTHVTIALGFAITEEAVEDNLYAELSKRKAKALGRAMATTKQVRAADLFNNGFSSSQLGGDGVALFSASHPTLVGNQSNIPSSHVDLSETALEQAMIDIAAYKDERGILIGAVPVSLHIPSALRFTAERILKSTLTTQIATIDANGAQAAASVLAATNRNDINAVRSMGMFSRGAHLNHRFTDADAWFIRTNVENGTKHFERVGLQTGDEGDFDTGNYRYKARERYSFGWSDWRQWYGTSGAG